MNSFKNKLSQWFQIFFKKTDNLVAEHKVDLNDKMSKNQMQLKKIQHVSRIEEHFHGFKENDPREDPLFANQHQSFQKDFSTILPSLSYQEITKVTEEVPFGNQSLLNTEGLQMNGLINQKLNGYKKKSQNQINQDLKDYKKSLQKI